MITEMLTIIVVFLTRRDREGASFSCSAAVFGVLINVMCLSLLLIAESKRCCPENDEVYTRLLGPDSSSIGYYDDPSAEEIECCPKFGERKYGGLGNIEPFTCLIALSPLRFIVARYIVRLFGSSGREEGLHPDKGTHGQHLGPDPTILVRDLWMTAIGLHSDIAKSFGLFSGELLQCMLGIYSHDNEKHPDPSAMDAGSSEANNESVQDGICHERENSLDIISDTSSRPGVISPTRSPARRYESDDFDLSFDDFAYPKARLIRRMRRAERMLLPLLNEWMVVDVVLTNHELVLFDVINEDGSHSCKNGGKGTQLCEVARGRKIVSQFNLDDVDFVDIEHRAAISGDADDEGEDIEVNRNNLLEYWQGGDACEDYEVDAMNGRWKQVDEDRLKIHYKYNTLYLRFLADLKEMEDKRKDLLDDPDLMHHIGSQSKVWCRTIARLRGAMNLKQNLPHFGNDGDDEMVDFIETKTSFEDENVLHGTDKIRKKFHRRFSSLHAQLEQSQSSGKGHRRFNTVQGQLDQSLPSNKGSRRPSTLSRGSTT